MCFWEWDTGTGMWTVATRSCDLSREVGVYKEECLWRGDEACFCKRLPYSVWRTKFNLGGKLKRNNFSPKLFEGSSFTADILEKVPQVTTYFILTSKVRHYSDCVATCLPTIIVVSSHSRNTFKIINVSTLVTGNSRSLRIGKQLHTQHSFKHNGTKGTLTSFGGHQKSVSEKLER